jgi:hypothetical protein
MGLVCSDRGFRGHMHERGTVEFASTGSRAGAAMHMGYWAEGWDARSTARASHRLRRFGDPDRFDFPRAESAPPRMPRIRGHFGLDLAQLFVGEELVGEQIDLRLLSFVGHDREADPGL